MRPDSHIEKIKKEGFSPSFFDSFALRKNSRCFLFSGCFDCAVRSTFVCVKVVTTVKTVNASAGIDKFLLAGIERVAFGTNFHAYILASRTGMDYLAAGARDRCVNVLGMNAFLQLMSPLFCLCSQLQKNTTHIFSMQVFF